MDSPLNIHEPLLVNTLGHSAGALIFATFLYLYWRSRHGRPVWRLGLPGLAAFLAFGWNVASLVVLAVSGRASALVSLTLAIGFSVLSLLPAVLFHIALQGQNRTLWLTGYAVAGAAVALHAAELAVLPGTDLHELGLNLITAAFAVLIVLALVAISRRAGAPESGLRSRVLAAMSLFFLAVSFVHFGPGHDEHLWLQELAIHHAGIPLALFVLLQDYRFLWLDVFIRFLVNAALAVAVTISVIGVELRWGIWEKAAADPFLLGLTIVAFCGLFIGFAALRNRLQHWLTRAVFQRSDLGSLLERLRRLGAQAGSEQHFLRGACRAVADFLQADEFAVHSLNGGVPGAAAPSLLPATVDPRSPWRQRPQTVWAEAAAPLLFPSGDVRYLLLGARRAGRPYLSGDLQDLAAISAVIVEQVGQLRRQELQSLVAEAELRALRAQINPHFLFNALNALYGIIPRSAASARKTVLNLSEIFRYSLMGDKQLLSLGDELRIVRAYLEVESIRLGPRLQTELDIDEEALPLLIPALSIQPLVENAVKHGINPLPQGGKVGLSVRRRETSWEVAVCDTGPGFAPGTPAAAGQRNGVGLDNVRQRLKLCCGPDAELFIESSSQGSRVGYRVPAAAPAGAGVPH